MKRREILNTYAITDGVIVSPGRFAGEPIYAPHFHEAMHLDGETTLDVLDADRAEFPELGAAHAVSLVDDGDCVTTELHGARQ